MPRRCERIGWDQYRCLTCGEIGPGNQVHRCAEAPEAPESPPEAEELEAEELEAVEA